MSFKMSSKELLYHIVFSVIVSYLSMFWGLSLVASISHIPFNNGCHDYFNVEEVARSEFSMDFGVRCWVFHGFGFLARNLTILAQSHSSHQPDFYPQQAAVFSIKSLKNVLLYDAQIK